MPRYRRNDPPAKVEKPFPTAGEDRLRAHLDPDTPQTRSPAYRLGFADNELLLRDELRPVRLQLEFLKPDLLQTDRGVELTVAVWGSARILPPEVAQARLGEAEELARANPEDHQLAWALGVARAMADKSKYYVEARRLGQLISQTQLHVDSDVTGVGHAAADSAMRSTAVDSPAEAARAAAAAATVGAPAPGTSDTPAPAAPGTPAPGTPVFVVTGGGPGIMEAANRGAYDIGAESIAHNIVLPFEQMPNLYITPDLCFNFHYFAIRKMHFLMRSVALVVFPGGFGTLDELFEVLTLIQTHKIRPIPVLLFGREYWEHIINFQALVDEGVITPADLTIFSFVETADEAWCLLQPAIKQAVPTCERPVHNP